MDTLHHVMISFSTIPLSDIQLLLSVNDKPIPKLDRVCYEVALNLPLTKCVLPTLSIVDWTLAMKVSNNISEINLSTILGYCESELLQLAQSLLLETVDRVRIFRILRYLGKLNEDTTLLGYLPSELMMRVIDYTRCDDLMSFRGLISDSIYTDEYIANIMRKRIQERSGLIMDDVNDQDTLIRLSKLDQYSNISACGLHSLVCNQDGKVYSFGSNTSGQLGTGDNKMRKTPTLIPLNEKIVSVAGKRFSSLLSTNNGQVYICGNNINGSIPKLIHKMNNIVQVSGSSHVLLLTAEGHVYGFGDNSNGQLGLGDYIYRSHFVFDSYIK